MKRASDDFTTAYFLRTTLIAHTKPIQLDMRSSELLLRHISKGASPSIAKCRPITHPSTSSLRYFSDVRERTSVWIHHGLSPIRPTYSRLNIPLLSSSSSSLSRTPHRLRPFSVTSLRKEKPISENKKVTKKPQVQATELDQNDEEHGFAKSEKASQASQVNLSARLAKGGGSQDQSAGWGEIWRLIRIARPEAKVLTYAFVLLLVSSSITMSIPFSIGKILDIATKTDGGDTLFGLSLPTFYVALGGVLAVGAAANYGRIIILRIVGERIVARLRSQLFRRTFVQNAEFFDANRVGDLISRLSSDTIIVGKSITQNLSDGLRSLVSGGAGFGLMAYVSLKLTGILTLMFPPVAIGAFFYGKAIRNLSRRIQKNLGTLTKIAEERLGNVRTSQAFAGEILEVGRYNKQTKKIFHLGVKEAFISATFFSTVRTSINVFPVTMLTVYRPA